jgi:Thioredoxin
MPEFPPPVRLFGEPPPPAEPYAAPDHEPPAVVDDDVDVFGAEAAAADLTERLAQLPTAGGHRAQDGRQLLSPPFDIDRDRIDGPLTARKTLVAFGAHGTPSSVPLGKVLAHVREQHPLTVAVAWRHYPDPAAHPSAVVLALAAEAAAARGKFWALTRELLHVRGHEPRDLHAAMVRVGVDPQRAAAEMRAGTGADRVVEDVASALASGVTFTPALFIDGERYPGELDPRAVSDALSAER